ncbi:MAG: phosphoglucomutase/phosphomannomutase family protein [Clostridiales bacterium]|nr:phosphoglucomutase/phosphomannomutase family protein [Clostridiales bacterium]
MIKFGTGGWRVIIGDEFTKQNIQLLGQGLSDLITKNNQQNKPIVIGYDRRFLSDIGAKWISEVLAGNDLSVMFINKNAPTPMIMFEVKRVKACYGIAITASHNPALYNGIKLFTSGGRDASMETTDLLEQAINKVKDIKIIDYDEGIKKGLIKVIDPFNDYIDKILKLVDNEAIKKAGLKILLDPMYGVSKTCLQTILLTLRCDLEVINDRHDTLFGGKLPSPSALTLGRLTQLVKEENYDLGIGTDGDADRLGVIDDLGNFIHPNEILVLLYYYLVVYKGWKGDVVRNLATTNLLDDLAKDFGMVCHEVPVGFKHVSSKMEETDAVIGGESSGGLTIRGHIKGKDGIFAASLLVEMISVTKMKISELLQLIYDKYGYRIMVENAFSFKKDKKVELVNLLYNKKELPSFPFKVKNTNYMDGVKVNFENNGWIIARFSGTEPLLRVFAEMPNKEQADEVCQVMKDFLEI